MIKFLRKCQLKIERNNYRTETKDGVVANILQTPDSHITVDQDLQIEFEVRRAMWAQCQEATFRIKNLSRDTYTSIYKDPRNMADLRAIQFRAGYENSPLSLCFNGTVMSCITGKDSGSTEVITEIECQDGGFAMANGITSRTFPAGTPAYAKIEIMVQDLPEVDKKNIVIDRGSWNESSQRGESVSGPTWPLISAKTGYQAIIDNGQLKVLRPDQCVQGVFDYLDASSGLLGTPKQTNVGMDVEMLFEPRLVPGQALEVFSEVLPWMNGNYKVMGFSHRGVMGPAESGTCTTTVHLYSIKNFFTVPGRPVQ